MSKIAITGIGAATPLGNNYRQIADNLLAGRSGVRAVTSFRADEHPSSIAGQIEAPPCPAGFPPEEFDRLNGPHQLSLWCAAQALADAGLWERRSDLRIGLILGTATEWNWTWEMDAFQCGGRQLYEPQAHRPAMTDWLRQTLGLQGPSLSLSAACASGNYALALARRWLRLGWVDACLAGGADLALTPMILAAFGNLRALSRRNDAPAAASRPFDRDRDGFVLSEGGVVFVLEGDEAARSRGVPIRAELAGHGAASDAYHMVIPSPDPGPAAQAMRRALADAGIGPDAVDHVNAHATSTPAGDIAEARVLCEVFGPHIDKVAVSSTKSMTGHLLTAAAAFEALACIVALEKQAVPPTINLDHPDPACPLCHVPHQAQERRVGIAVSNSFGFGGSNTCLVLRKAG